mmetsp:Transcript_80108/g.179280  ORF Transcript_80108/g.179280 Transcript_80108/m.179280 type:complete len:172 (-) Transcript_80108:123-638(-)
MALRSPNSTMRSSGRLAKVEAETSGNHLGLFKDAHDVFEQMGSEVEDLKKSIAYNEGLRKAEMEEVRKALEQERLARRNALNELRYEFEAFVHKKIDKVIDEVEDMKRTERHHDTFQQISLDGITEDVDRLKENLLGVQTAWNRLVSEVLVPPEDKVPQQSSRAQTAGRQL